MEWTLIAAAAALTSTLSGALGMAGGFLLMGLCSALLPVGPAMIVHGVTQAAANGSRWWLHRSHADTRGIAAYVAGALAAAGLAAAISLRVDAAALHAVLGVIPFAALALRGRASLSFATRGGAALCGAAVTATQLVAGVSGPILDTFFVASPLGRFAVVATKASTQTLAHILKIAYFAVFLPARTGADLASMPPLWALVLCCVSALGGTVAGARFLDRMDDALFRRIGNVAVLLMGAGHLVWAAVLASQAA